MRLPYQEGSYFEVPLRNGRTGLGVVARMGSRGETFGHFFASDFHDKAVLDPQKYIRAENSVLCLQFGDLHLINGEWTVLGTLENWTREDWPLPKFYRIIKDLNLAYVVEYSEDLVLLSETKVSIHELDLENYQGDFLAGAGAVEIRLTKIDDEKQ